MKFKIQNRQTGKTYDIAQNLMKDIKSIVIVPNLMMKKKFIHDYGFDGRVFTINEVMYKDALKGKKDVTVYMDEVGNCLQLIIQHNIIYGTHTDF